MLARLEAVGYPARVVGGAVRDALLGRPALDADIATPARPEQVQAVLTAAGIPCIPTGLKHGTVTAVIDHAPVEITTLRRDALTDGRHAQIEFTADWAEDAVRRDFTMNALYADRHGTVYDPLGGLADVRAGRLRFIGDADARLAEDRLRALRLFRFQAWIGRTPLDPGDLAAIGRMVAELPLLSAERIWAELKKLLAAPDPRPGLAPMRATGALAILLPEAGDEAVLAALLARGNPADPLLRLAALTGPCPAAPLAGRLRWSGAERDRFTALQTVAEDRDSRPFALWRRLGAAALDLGARLGAARGSLPAERVAALSALADQGPPPDFPLTGRDLIALGVAPGPAMGQILRGVETWWIAGDGAATADACRAELAHRVAAAARAGTQD